MKSKARILIILAAMLCLIAVVTVMGSTTVGINEVIAAYSNLKHAESLDGQMYLDKVNAHTKEIAELTKQKADLDTKYIESQEKMNATDEENTKADVEELTTDVMYKKVVDAGDLNNTAITKYYTFDDNTFTVSMKGTLTELNKTLQSMKKNLDQWNVSFGNLSLRQDYDAYNLQRSYDSGTMVEWYDNKIVNALGETLNLSDLLTEEETDTGTIYTVASLDDVKFDTEGMNLETLASNSSYEDRINKKIEGYGNQLSILEKTEYTEEVKKALRAKLENDYTYDMGVLNEKKEKAAAAIEAKYQKKYAQDKEKVATAIRTYQDKLDKLRSMLADSSMLKYELDITIRCDQ